jgi:hypothetical protein
VDHQHAYIELEHDGRSIPIDVGIAPVIEALWARGIDTTGSCEDWDADVLELPEGTAAIAFVHAADAHSFAEACRESAGDKTVAIGLPDAQDIALGAEQGAEPWEATVLFPLERVPRIAERLS